LGGSSNFSHYQTNHLARTRMAAFLMAADFHDNTATAIAKTIVRQTHLWRRLVTFGW
jgi:hypothetical protein